MAAPVTLKRRLKNVSKDLLRTAFEAGQRLGVDILPRHFYSEIPDIRVLRNSSQWRLPRSFEGILGGIDAQTEWADRCTKEYRSGLKGFQIHESAVKMNGSDEGYGEVEADFLYCFIRTHKPAQIVQVGCGVSTAICLIAAQDEDYAPEITCIEPYPTDFLKRESQAGRLNLVAKKLEDVGPACVSSLGAADLFFVDSSHTLGPAGEVNLIILEILPRIATGVYVHFHDIYFPYDYDPTTLSTALFFQHETALLYSFLVLNERFEIACSLAMLHHYRLGELQQYFPDMKPAMFDRGLKTKLGQAPSSIYLRRLGS
jgi:hypothetical protein